MAVSQSLTLTESNIVASANTSQVRILWQSTQTGDSWNGYTRAAKYYVSINGGAETEYLVNYTLPQNKTVTILDTTITVNHSSDGTGKVEVRTWMDTRISADVLTKETSLDLATIPRASSLDALSCNTAYFNATLTFKYTPKSASFYNRCEIALLTGGTSTPVKTIDLGQKATSQQTYDFGLSLSERETVYKKLTDTTKGTLRFTLTTYSDGGYSTRVGDAVNKDINLIIPEIDETQPTATLELTPHSTLPSPFNTLYIKGKTKVYVDMKDIVGKYGATITSYTVSLGGASTAPPYESEYLTKDVTITGIITDSRGYSRKYTRTISVIDYAEPQLLPIEGESEVVAARCIQTGDITPGGNAFIIKAKRSYSKVSGHNNCYIRYRYKQEGEEYSDWTTILEATATDDGITTKPLHIGDLNLTSTYLVQIQAIDAIGETATTTISLPTESVYMHRAGSINSLGIGKYAEKENTVDIAEDKMVIVRGDLIIGNVGDVVADFPVAVGESGIWKYRKWHSGIAECWGKNIVSVTLKDSWNAVYYATIAEVAYPFAFIDAPDCQVTAVINNASWLACNYRGTATATPKVALYNPDKTASEVCDITYYAIGRWRK